MNKPIPILKTQGLKKYFPVTKGLLVSRLIGWIKAVDGLDFEIYPGDTFGLVGESGCGKTTTSRIILKLEKKTSGSLFFDNKDIDTLEGEELIHFRGSVQAVFQDPYASL